MSKQFFDMRTPSDMLRKAEREYNRLMDKLDIDNIFNFFVTAYHIWDYIREGQIVRLRVLLDFLATPNLAQCNLICNKGKHLYLEPRRSGPRDKPTEVRHFPGAIPGRFVPGQVAPGAGGTTFFYVDNVKVDIRDLAKNVLDDWRAFFTQHNIT